MLDNSISCHNHQLEHLHVHKYVHQNMKEKYMYCMLKIKAGQECAYMR